MRVTDALCLGIGGTIGRCGPPKATSISVETGEIVPMRYAAEQAHLLVQGSYKFGLGAAR